MLPQPTTRILIGFLSSGIYVFDKVLQRKRLHSAMLEMNLQIIGINGEFKGNLN
jgi:hypothetical protein